MQGCDNAKCFCFFIKRWHFLFPGTGVEEKFSVCRFKKQETSCHILLNGKEMFVLVDSHCIKPHKHQSGLVTFISIRHKPTQDFPVNSTQSRTKRMQIRTKPRSFEEDHSGRNHLIPRLQWQRDHSLSNGFCHCFLDVQYKVNINSVQNNSK